MVNIYNTYKFSVNGAQETLGVVQVSDRHFIFILIHYSYLDLY